MAPTSLTKAQVKSVPHSDSSAAIDDLCLELLFCATSCIALATPHNSADGHSAKAPLALQEKIKRFVERSNKYIYFVILKVTSKQ